MTMMITMMTTMTMMTMMMMMLMMMNGADDGDDAANDDGSVDYMITPAFNVSGAEAVILNFASYFDGAYGQSASIGISEDGTSFTEVYQLAPYL